MYKIIIGEEIFKSITPHFVVTVTSAGCKFTYQVPTEDKLVFCEFLQAIYIFNQMVKMKKHSQIIKESVFNLLYKKRIININKHIIPFEYFGNS